MKTLKAPKKDRSTVVINEEFIPVDSRPLDSKNRITLGGRLIKLMVARMKIDSYKVFLGKAGDILLRPAVSIPSSEAWIYRNPKVIGKIRKGLEEAAQGAIEKVEDLDEFLKDL